MEMTLLKGDYMINIIFPVIAALVASVIAFLLAKNRQRVDRGFVFNYYRLSYRRKYIRSLISIPIVLVACMIIYTLAEWPVSIKNGFVIIFLIVVIIQVIYNYKMWKKHEENE